MPDPGGAAPARTGPFDPTDVTHIPLRLPFYADNIRRRQRRLERPLAPADARPYVLRLFHEHVLQLGTIVLMAFGLLFVMSLLQDGLGGAVEMLLRQALWAAPMGGALYGLARFLLVPPAPRVNG